MKLDRRRCLGAAAGGLLAGALAGASAPRPTRYRAVAFDAFPVFDPRPIAALAESLFPGDGPALMAAWRARQFEYQWLRALAGQYEDFPRATRDGLVFAAGQLGLELPPEKRDRLMAAWSGLEVWPDAPEALRALREAGLRLAFLSNMTAEMLGRGLERAGLDGMFEAVLSTDRIRSYKPDRRAYQIGVDALGLPKEEILFAAFAGWDVAGAKWFGYPTFWVNRAGAPQEELGVEADAAGPDLAALVSFAVG